MLLLSSLKRLFPLALFLLMSIHLTNAGAFRTVLVITGHKAGPVEENVAQLLVNRLNESGVVTAQTAGEEKQNFSNSVDLIVYLGISARHNGISNLLQQKHIPELTSLAPGPEGFLLKLVKEQGQPLLLATGTDERGCLYAVGELLRQASFDQGHMEIPDALEVRTAPAFEIRGTQYGQSGVAKSMAGVRDWTEEETQRVILDYALAGANIFNTCPGPHV